MGELAYPVGHPAHPDYKGEPWKNPAAYHYDDYPEGHTARNGANVRAIDTPDGQRAAQLKQTQDLQQLAMLGSLPPVVDPETHEPLALTPKQLALVYSVRNGLPAPMQEEVTYRYKLAPIPPHASDVAVPAHTPEEQALAHIMSLGYTPERAREILAKYGVPDVITDKKNDEHR